MNFQDLAQAAQLTHRHLQAIRSHDLQEAISKYFANRQYGAVSLSSAIVSHLIDAKRIDGHSWQGDSLARFDTVLHDAIGLLERALPKIVNPLQVEERDIFEPRELA